MGVWPWMTGVTGVTGVTGATGEERFYLGPGAEIVQVFVGTIGPGERKSSKCLWARSDLASENRPSVVVWHDQTWGLDLNSLWAVERG
eukprot:CAMPEP_0206250338 /NCGR_PEP_ID=MMETSP0047_2-20121206/21417_1 /ASSEMBLY_ACC=CAM_ASM_000192 /TAXON_ID=195065 /ORGANISM="Chroomonas mesostigmatica_cf, Strain CCMP1168" /LENGTH=87 /DNA_ID=CAMNT_0053676177 /DNA_START=84 /DNA_END=347 /DNA_ORIENTATION=-